MSSHEPTETDKRIIELKGMLDGCYNRIIELEDEVRDLKQSLAECEESA